MSKVILITGTSTGFGRTAAETLAQRGYTVFGTIAHTGSTGVFKEDSLAAAKP